MVCIEHNPRVRISDFRSVVEDGFKRHGIETRVVEPPAGEDCEYVLTYTALRSWDIVPYMNRAELRVRRDDSTIGTASYSHAGGLGLNKFRGTRAKMEPVIEELMANLPAPP